MKIFHYLKYVGLSVFLAIALVLVGINFAQAKEKGVKAKPSSSWRAVILDTVGSNLKGVGGSRYSVDDGGWIYDDSESDVTIYATIGRIGGAPYRTVFRFECYYPAQVEIQGVSQNELYLDPDLNYCGYPPDGSYTKCLFDFLNNNHPWDDKYTRIHFGFFGPYVSSRNEADWEQMEIGETKPLRTWINIEAMHNPYSFGNCSECDRENYHSIEMNTHDACLTRDSIDTWRVIIDTDFNNPDYPASTVPPFDSYYTESDFILERYCECVLSPFSKPKKPRYITEFRHPSWGRGHVQFEINFIYSGR